VNRKKGLSTSLLIKSPKGDVEEDELPSNKERKLSHDKIFKTLIHLFLRDMVELLGRDIGRQLDFASVQYLSGESFSELKTTVT
jgi:hypothetical protein